MTSIELTKKIKQSAFDLGFDLVGITDASPPTSFSIYQDWIADGNHGQMNYLSSDRALSHRQDLQKVLPNCQSVIMLGKKITPSQFDSEKKEAHGKVASYAWNLDYHDTLLPLLKKLSEQIQTFAQQPVNARYYTDTGPILERELASRAGLGWIGKNSMLINPDLGSFFLIAELLVDIELKPDEPFSKDHCGNCTKCIEACPTSCILPNRTIDSRRCLSYLTIELKEAIPCELRPYINDWIFGCDICQQVCPWNKRSTPSTDPNFVAREGIAQPNLLNDLELTSEEFNKKFKGSPIKRTKRRGYLRNILIILGNKRNPKFLPLFEKILNTESETLIRQHAAWAIGQLDSQEALAKLSYALESEESSEVIEEIKLAINNIKNH